MFEKSAGFCASLVLGSLLASGLALAGETGGESATFRGPTRDGILKEPLSVSWAANGPKQLFKTAIGSGYSSMSVADKRLYAMGNAGGQDTVFCFDTDKGTEIWKQSYACASPNDYPGTRATPTVDGDKLFTLSRKGHLYCFDAAKGTVVWKRDLIAEEGLKTGAWDFAGSVLIQDKLLILNVGSSGMAVDKATGKTVWLSGKEAAGYSTPVPYTADGKKCLAIFGGAALFGHDLESGKQLWSLDWKTNYGVNSIDPIMIAPDKMFITSDYGYGCALLQVAPTGVTPVYQNKNLACHTSNPVYVNGHIYGFDGNQGTPGVLKCLEVASGKVTWSKPGMMGSILATSDGKLLILTVKGELLAAQINPAAYTELARAQVLSGQCWTPPVLCGGKLYARNTAGDLIGLDLGK